MNCWRRNGTTGYCVFNMCALCSLHSEGDTEVLVCKTKWEWHCVMTVYSLRFASVCTALMIMCGCGCAYSGCVGVNICSPEECVSGQQWEFLSSALVGHNAAACLSKLPHWRYALSFSHLLNFPSFALARSHFHFSTFTFPTWNCYASSHSFFVSSLSC